MERLGHVINGVVTNGRWKLISLERGGPPLLHLFFTDDLVLFGEASLENMVVMQRILEELCCYSGNRVNASKSKLFFSHKMDIIINRVLEMCWGSNKRMI